VGKTFRLVEWDLALAPKEPNGDMVSVQVRTGQISRQGIREAISKAYDLESPKVVKQFAHMFVLHERVFYERVDTRESLAKLHDGDVLVWTKVRRRCRKMLALHGASTALACTQLGILLHLRKQRPRVAVHLR
jgi:hypothetical protein